MNVLRLVLALALAPALALALGLGGALWVTGAATPPPAADPAVIAAEATVVAVRAAVAAELGSAPTPTAPAAKASPTPGVDLPELRNRLRAYKAAGATDPLDLAVSKTLAGTGKPVGDTFYWSIQRRGGQRYTLTMRTTYANEPLTLNWDYDDATGHLRANDWQTRWASGW